MPTPGHPLAPLDRSPPGRPPPYLPARHPVYIPPAARPRRPAPPGSHARPPPDRNHPTQHHGSRPHGSAHPPHGCPAPPADTIRPGRPTPAATDGPAVRLPHVGFRLSDPRSYGRSCICIRQIRWLRYPPPEHVRSPHHGTCGRYPPGRATPYMPARLPPVRLPIVRQIAIRHLPGGDIPAPSRAHPMQKVRLRRPTYPAVAGPVS